MRIVFFFFSRSVQASNTTPRGWVFWRGVHHHRHHHHYCHHRGRHHDCHHHRYYPWTTRNCCCRNKIGTCQVAAAAVVAVTTAAAATGATRQKQNDGLTSREPRWLSPYERGWVSFLIRRILISVRKTDLCVRKRTRPVRVPVSAKRPALNKM